MRLLSKDETMLVSGGASYTDNHGRPTTCPNGWSQADHDDADIVHRAGDLVMSAVFAVADLFK